MATLAALAPDTIICMLLHLDFAGLARAAATDRTMSRRVKQAIIRHIAQRSRQMANRLSEYERDEPWELLHLLAKVDKKTGDGQVHELYEDVLCCEGSIEWYTERLKRLRFLGVDLDSTTEEPYSGQPFVIVCMSASTCCFDYCSDGSDRYGTGTRLSTDELCLQQFIEFLVVECQCDTSKPRYASEHMTGLDWAMRTGNVVAFSVLQTLARRGHIDLAAEFELKSHQLQSSVPRMRATSLLDIIRRVAIHNGQHGEWCLQRARDYLNTGFPIDVPGNPSFIIQEELDLHSDGGCLRPFIVACAYGVVEMVKELIARGVDPNVEDYDEDEDMDDSGSYKSGWWYAVKRQQWQVYDYLVERELNGVTPTKVIEMRKQELLSLASMPGENSEPTLQRVTRALAPQYRALRGETLEAVATKFSTTLEALIKLNGRGRARSKAVLSTGTWLLLPLECNSEAIKLLRDRKLAMYWKDINNPCKHAPGRECAGETTVPVSPPSAFDNWTSEISNGGCAFSAVPVIEAPNVNAKDESGRTAFMHARALGNVGMAELLISSKCDTSLKTRVSHLATNLPPPRGTNPFQRIEFTGWDLAIDNGHLAVVEFLLHQARNGHSQLRNEMQCRSTHSCWQFGVPALHRNQEQHRNCASWPSVIQQKNCATCSAYCKRHAAAHCRDSSAKLLISRGRTTTTISRF
jgi:hypothetical protein